MTTLLYPVGQKPRGLLILGFGGHARAVADVALAAGIETLRFIDANAREDEAFLGFPVAAQWSQPLPEHWGVFCAAGDNRHREEQFAQVAQRGWPLVTLIAPDASIGAGSAVGTGSLVGRHAHIGPAARVGQGCIVNTGAIVDHECAVEDFVHVSANAIVAGRCRIGRSSMIGAGATLVDGITIAQNVTIGAGGVVPRSIASAGTYVGVPVRRLDKD